MKQAKRLNRPHDAKDLDHALQIAKLCPAPNGSVEVRPCMIFD